MTLRCLAMCAAVTAAAAPNSSRVTFNRDVMPFVAKALPELPPAR